MCHTFHSLVLGLIDLLSVPYALLFFGHKPLLILLRTRVVLTVVGQSDFWPCPRRDSFKYRGKTRVVRLGFLEGRRWDWVAADAS